MTREPSSPDLPTRLGRYELIRPLARGGMANIYLARCLDGERQVAVKLLDAHRALEAEACAMFLHEARVCALLDHPNIAKVIDVDVAGGWHYLAMELVHGVDLRELLGAASRAGQTLPFETSMSIVAAAAAGLDYAHRQCDAEGRPLRLVHRDISLSNIMVAHDGGVKVVDFGIAQTTIASVHTSPGVVRGKASYMSPEQCLGEGLDHRTDVFALGIVLYELTTGARCFHGKSDFDRMLAVVRGEYVPPSQLVAGYPPALEQLIKRTLSIDPAHRYESCAALIEALAGVAAEYGWSIGTAQVARLMGALYGTVDADGAHRVTPELIVSCEPVVPAILELDITERSAPAVALAGAATSPSHELARGSTARLARGTEADALFQQPPAPPPDEDDAPTRGRRALKRPTTATPIAA